MRNFLRLFLAAQISAFPAFVYAQASNPTLVVTGTVTADDCAEFASRTRVRSAGAACGDMAGPASSTDNAIVRFDGATGKLVQNSAATVTDLGALNVTSSIEAQELIRLEGTGPGISGSLLLCNHVSTSPAANDSLCIFRANGRNSAANTEIYAQFIPEIVLPTSGSEASRWTFQTAVAGTLANRVHVGAGLYAAGTTGGDPGVNGINFTTILKSNNPVPARIEGTATYDPPSLADGAGVTTTVTVTGAALGDPAVASLAVDLQGIIINASVSATNTVAVRLQNETGATLDLASATLKAWALK